jgi:putative transposase
MKYPLVRDLAAEGVPVAVTCRVLGFSKQAFYAWRRDPVSQRDWDEAHLINAAIGIHADDPAFGYRFIADELAAAGIRAGENKVARLCSQQQIWSAFSKKRGLTRKAGPPVHDDLVRRQFTADGPDQLWLTDISEHPTAEGKLYLRAQGRVLQPDSRVLDGFPDDRVPGRVGAPQRHRAACTLRDPDLALRQGQPVPVRRFRGHAPPQRADRIYGQSRGMCR